ncbi:gamma-glutamyl-gamma-aminobutyrate hydrolase family protein [soil metagenome]
MMSEGGARPLVMISEGLADYGYYYGVGYPRPLLAAGAFPVLLAYLEDAADRREAIERADGLVLAGGRDIEPWRYGRTEPNAKQLAPAWRLDEIELDYATLAVDAGVPLLGICRGCQIINVAFGGTLYGDLDEFPEGGADHPGAKWDEWRALVDATLGGAEPAPHPMHPVDVAHGSLMAQHMGERYDVDSYHHQAIDRGGDGLVATAFAPHGTVEAVEMPEAEAFVLGVQWELHEEWQHDDRTLGVWIAFVDAARERRATREGAVVP